MNLSGVNHDKVVIFKNEFGVLKTSNIKWIDKIRRVFGATTDDIPVFNDGGRIRVSNVSISSEMKLKKCVTDRLKSA
ncbi:hypothetical protein CHS0354_028704, partial [Potamilus streckersoni]